MSSIPRQLATFAAVLAGLTPPASSPALIIDAEPQHGAAAAEGHSETRNNDTKTPAGEAHGAAAPDPVRGLAVAENGLRLVARRRRTARAADSEQLRFRIVDARGQAVRDFDVEHEKRMHLIVARRDLTGFQHLHPTMAERRHLVDAAARRRRRLLPRVRRLRPRGRGHDARRRPPRRRRRPTCGRCRRRGRPPSATAATTSRLDAGDARPGQEADSRSPSPRTARR